MKTELCQNALQTGGISKHRLCGYCGRKTHFENGACHEYTVVSYFLDHKSKMAGYCYVLKILWRSLDGEHLMRFRNETSVFKFPPAVSGKGLG